MHFWRSQFGHAIADLSAFDHHVTHRIGTVPLSLNAQLAAGADASKFAGPTLRSTPLSQAIGWCRLTRLSLGSRMPDAASTRSV